MRSVFRAAPVALAVVCAAGAGLLASCAADPHRGYSFESSYREDISTVHVPIFENLTFHRGVEVDLTSAIISRINSTTPWAVSSDPAAQTTLRGVVTEVELERLSTARDSGLVQELAYVITVDFEWKDNRSGEVLASRRKFQSSGSFVPSQGLQERIEVGRHEAVSHMADALVGELRSDW